MPRMTTRRLILALLLLSLLGLVSWMYWAIRNLEQHRPPPPVHATACNHHDRPSVSMSKYPWSALAPCIVPAHSHV